ncbi:hypothetical protein OAG99_02435, partial [Akkermansiaceae bacterium]|nr:hypothetical protein [Akkermansiaceae bacterium]
TFLSLTESNKIRIQFVQGKFGMGSTGVLRFCGSQNLQLIISRRHPDARMGEADDDKWGFTVIRRENPTAQMKSSVFTYLAPQGDVLSFNADTLPILPAKYPEASGEPFEYGSFIKMYEYNIGPSLRSTLTLDLFNRLSLLVPGIALPVRCYERREYDCHSYESALSGLTTRIETDRSDNLEKGFPADAQITVDGHKMGVQILAFKEGKRENYSKADGVLFTQHGQNHGSFNHSFFTRKSVGMSYLHKDLLVIVDCSDLPGRSREDLFMNSRDRLCDCRLKTEIEKELSSIIKDHKGLKSLREQRKKDAIASKIGDSKPVIDVLSKLLKDSPALTNLLGSGNRLSHPFSTKKTGDQNDFTGKRFPTYFTASRKHTKAKPKQCHQGSKFRVSYETDANNDYFGRDCEPGTYELLIDGIPSQFHPTYDLWNGHFNLQIALPQSAKLGQVFEVKLIVDDLNRIDPIEDTFWVEQVGPKKQSGTPGSRRKPSSSKNGDKNSGPSQLDLPPIYPVEREAWEKHKFDQYSALKVIHSGKGNNYDFYYNADNSWLKIEQKRARDEDTEIIETQYKSSLVLIGLSLLQAEKSKKSEDESVGIEEKIFETTSALSPLLIPMIRSLGGLTKDD